MEKENPEAVVQIVITLQKGKIRVVEMGRNTVVDVKEFTQLEVATMLIRKSIEELEPVSY